jgi:hypothetical protein
MTETPKHAELMSREQALGLVRKWQLETKRMNSVERGKYIEEKLAALGPDVERLARRILNELMKPPSRP